MSFSRKTILTALFAITVVASTVETANACGGRRSGGSSRSYSSSSYSGYSSYSAPSHSYRYAAPVQHYSTPSYHYSQPTNVVRSQPIQQQFQPVQTQIAPIRMASQQQPVQGGQPGFQQQAAQPSFQQPGGLRPVSQQQISQQPAAQQPQLAPQPTAPRQTAPAVQQPLAPQNAAQSALQALGGFAPPATSPTVSTVQPASQPHVGSWTAAVGNGSTVTLTLEDDGHFRWVATNQAGQSSSFEGTYSISNGSLSLQRANDNQQLAGSMNTTDSNAFSFKVAGTNAAALNFQRS